MKTARERFEVSVAGVIRTALPISLSAAQAMAVQIAKLPERATAFLGDHDEFVEQILANAPESWDADEAAESIAVDYVRCLEDYVREFCHGELPERGES